ncbi:hypothetical protein Stsp01_29810 [Streptomyces sp. NBRC 13847]|nr:hypothetical protein Stsp01_29810 [Streptomyces sp. NBRC 13847]
MYGGGGVRVVRAPADARPHNCPRAAEKWGPRGGCAPCGACVRACVVQTITDTKPLVGGGGCRVRRRVAPRRAGVERW